MASSWGGVAAIAVGSLWAGGDKGETWLPLGRLVEHQLLEEELKNRRRTESRNRKKLFSTKRASNAKTDANLTYCVLQVGYIKHKLPGNCLIYEFIDFLNFVFFLHFATTPILQQRSSV